MPIGVMADALSVALGGLTGAVCCKRISEEMKEKLTLIFGLCSMGIGISSIVCMKNLPAVVLAMVAGTALGVVLRIGRKIEWACGGHAENAESQRGRKRFAGDGNGVILRQRNGHLRARWFPA